MGWILGKIKWFLLAATVAGPVLAYSGWAENAHIANIEKNGVETFAAIDGATRSKKRRRAATYWVDLSWKDAQGKPQTAKKVSISSELAKSIIKDDAIIVDNLPIKYLQGDKAGVPVVMNNVAAQIENNDFMVKVGGAAGLLGLLGTIGGFVWGRRKGAA
ncbi:MAG: hypothetical protein ACRBCJ_08195 [Hyphomicrobiaceae bacterium]